MIPHFFHFSEPYNRNRTLASAAILRIFAKPRGVTKIAAAFLPSQTTSEITCKEGPVGTSPEKTGGMRNAGGGDDGPFFEAAALRCNCLTRVADGIDPDPGPWPQPWTSQAADVYPPGAQSPNWRPMYKKEPQNTFCAEQRKKPAPLRNLFPNRQGSPTYRRADTRLGHTIGACGSERLIPPPSRA